MARKMKKAFTLVELLISIAILIIIFSFSSPFLLRFNNSQELGSVAEEMVSVLRKTQEKSINAEMDFSWGVDFSNQGGYVIFNDNGKFEDYAINEQIILKTSSTTVKFEKLSGQIEKDFEIILTRDDISYKIDINQEGMINYFKQ